MQITCFSFFISIVWSSILVMIIYLCRKTHFFIRQFGVTSLLLLYLFCVMRMIIPLEFIFTRGLSSKGMFSDFYKSIELDKIGMSQVSVLAVLFYIWIIVSMGLVIRFMCQYGIAMRKVSSYTIREDKQCKKVFGQVINDSKKQMKVSVRCSEDVNIPMGIGILRKTIILPDEEYSEQELYYILLHEYTHFLNRDLLVKMLIHIFCCVFWWNPITYLLKKDLNQALEIKCDLCVTKQMDHNGKVDYLTTIVSILKKANAKKTRTLFYGTAGLVSKDYKSEVVERFKIVSENGKLQSKNRILTVVWFLTFFIMIIFSYSFVIQPCYEAPIEEIETEPGTQEVKSNNSYIIKNRNETYTIVMPSGKRQTVDEEFALEMENQGFKIIKEEKYYE